MGFRKREESISDTVHWETKDILALFCSYGSDLLHLKYKKSSVDMSEDTKQLY